MAKKKSGHKAKPLTELNDETVVGRPLEPAEAGLVLTAVPQAPAAVAREELLRAIAGEATAISKAKHKGRSCKALRSLARAYALVAAGETHNARPARTGSGTGVRRFLPSMRPVFLLRGTRARHHK
ncbi:hypothetical protein [Streptomyces sp. NPDC052496]|uniref:hypothetical protein n=1 Tax=Streptomyces sp. NPDC052496 TaxID=3154951 RepID=UPI00343C45EA